MRSNRPSNVKTLAVADTATQSPFAHQGRAHPRNLHLRALKRKTPHPFHRISEVRIVHGVRSTSQKVRLMHPAVLIGEGMLKFFVFAFVDATRTRS